MVEIANHGVQSADYYPFAVLHMPGSQVVRPQCSTPPLPIVAAQAVGCADQESGSPLKEHGILADMEAK